MKNKKVLVVGDEPKCIALLCDHLRKASLQTFSISSNHQIENDMVKIEPDLILIDSIAAEKNNASICQAISNRTGLPFMVFSVEGNQIERLLSLSLGADDYICLPVNPRELIARVKALLRRASPKPRLPCENKRIIMHPTTKFVSVEGIPVELTPVEFRLLNALIQNPGRVFSRAQLLDAAYNDYRVVSDRTADSHIKNLRRKLGELTPDTDWIESVYGVGYRFNPSTPNPSN